MKASSFLFTSKSKKKYYRIMEKKCNSISNVSVDSLEVEVQEKSVNGNKPKADDAVDTILVPFYEQDVLIKVPKDQKKPSKEPKKFNKIKKITTEPSSYLVNKDKGKAKRPSYLEIFRKQVGEDVKDKNEEAEIRSLSPEIGDTERDSIEDDDNAPSEFFNTEAYNEIYYEKLINEELFEDYLEDSCDENLPIEDTNNKSSDNLRSVSEISVPRRQRRTTVQAVQNVKLGGLGPDMESIKPRLERARSLQRYSEKIRMENRLKIYKKNVEKENDKKMVENSAARRHDVAKLISKENQEEINASYLQQEEKKEKAFKTIRNICSSKSKSSKDKIKISNKEVEKAKTSGDNSANEKLAKERIKSSRRTPNAENSGNVTPPVQISFLVNVGSIQQSSALKRLEEKHRMYQEKVKTFRVENFY